MRTGGIELGGTKTIVVAAHDAAIVAERSFATRDPAATLADAIALLRRWHAEAPLAAIGIAAFGPVVLDPAAPAFGTLLATPKPGWSGAAVHAPIAAAFDIPVGLESDVIGAALAEYRWGAGRGADTLVYLTIGTGVGGGVLVAGRPVHGLLHPEMGHVRPRRSAVDGFGGACPFHGDCIEGLVSGPALAARFGVRASAVPADDPRWDAPTDDLAEWLAALFLTIAPDRVIIGGGVGIGVPWLAARAAAALPGRIGSYPGGDFAARAAAAVVPPALGAHAGPLGAIAVALRAARRDTMR